MKIDSLEKVNINNSEQWILVRGNNSITPLVIHVQAGPGLPIIPEANEMKKILSLENNYLVAYWDQRGCGKSYSKNIDPKTINLSQLSDDVIECTKYLLVKYNRKKAILIGYSIGATISLIAATKNSNIFSQLFLIGIDIDIPAANKYALEFAMSKAREINRKNSIRQIDKLNNKSIIETKIFQERAKLLTDLNGLRIGSSYNKLVLSTVKNMLLSKAYGLKDIFKTINGMEFCQNAMLTELDSLNLFKKVKTVSVPVHFVHGKLDGIAPYQTTSKFFEYLQTDTKTFTVFENSAHMPHYEEPKKFRELLNKYITVSSDV